VAIPPEKLKWVPQCQRSDPSQAADLCWSQMAGAIGKETKCRYGEQLASDYSANRTKYNETDDAMNQALEKFNLRGKIILDVGCGQGIDLEKICRLGGISIGFDSSARMLDERNLTPSEVFLADAADRLPLRENSIDVIFSNFVFHYIRNSSQLFRELSRVLTLGGIIVATLNISEVREGYQDLYNTPMPIRLGGEVSSVIVHNLIKSRAEIEDAIQRNGFSIEKEEELDHPNAVIDPNAVINSETEAFEGRTGTRFTEIVTKKVILLVLRKNRTGFEVDSLPAPHTSLCDRPGQRGPNTSNF
jgi:ubiquinone/menaquinone biosynthesis C-methylase UbiE